MARIALRVCVTGQVQGVFFRAWTRQQADELCVTGWVRNCADGSVEAHVEGEETAVQQLVQRMRKGPPDARVEELTASESSPENLRRFDVRH